MKLLVIQHAAGDRFRTVQYYKALEARGYEIADPHWSIKGEWSRYLKHAKKMDVIWIARRMLSFYRLHQLKKANNNIVFDYDDALYMRSSRHEGQVALSKKLKFNQVIKSAKSVVAGNEFLADAARNHVKEEKIFILPTVVNSDWYGEKEFTPDKPFVIGWLGSRSTLNYLQQMYPALRKFHEMGIPWKIRVISDAFPDWPDLPLEKISWTFEAEKEEVPQFDLGLNPLKDDDWCRGKCAIKAVQYMAGGVALAVSPVGVNNELLAGGDFGYAPTTTEEWTAAFKDAAENRKKTFEAGQRARKWALENYSMESKLDKLIHIFEDTVKRPR